MPPSDMIVSVSASVFSWEGLNMAHMQIANTQRARVVKLLKVIAAIQKDDAKPAAKTSKKAKVKVFDPAVVFGTTTLLTDMVANIKARAVALLLKV